MAPGDPCRVAMSAASPYRFAIVDPRFAQTVILLESPPRLLVDKIARAFQSGGLPRARCGANDWGVLSGCGVQPERVES
jgi:hypothetical protein